MKVGVAVCALACALMRGAADVLPALPDAAYADTEVSTNIPFNVARNDAREFGIAMSFAGTASNCVQIAFGRDADCDGELSPEETAMALGWRRGAYFVEGAGVRTSEAADAEWAGARSLSLRVGLDGALRPRAVGITNETGGCFAAIEAAVPGWLYGADWDMMRVTRRGVDAPDETLAVECLYRFFYISIR